MDKRIFQEVVWPHRSVVEYFPGSHAHAFESLMSGSAADPTLTVKLGHLTYQDTSLINPKQHDLQVSTANSRTKTVIFKLVFHACRDERK